ncbi:MAG: hypothetical protein DHS20C11_02220 [Lysobacteraceae bacterium]|nr:MAG: hypothetical protein DHS20C11_02220 [Xanthomonadaceae bacterium]
MTDWSFAMPWVAALLPLPLLMRWLLPAARNSGPTAVRVPFYDHFADQGSTGQSKRAALIALLAALAWIALTAAAMRPQHVGEPISLPISGRDLMLAVDISGSMDTKDMVVAGATVTRLSTVKAVIDQFIERRQGDRIGLILFGKRAYLQAPLTFDLTTVRTFLQEAAIGLAGKETAIGDAIGLSVKRLRDQIDANRVLILLTDGANTAGEVEPLRAADLAAAEDVKVYTIGVGADEMVVRSFFGNRKVNPSADLDEDTLRGIASKTGGRYFRARDTEGLAEIYSILDQLEPLAEEQEVYRPVTELFHWPLLISLLLTSLLVVLRAGMTEQLA